MDNTIHWKNAIRGIAQYVFLTGIRWIVIYPSDGVIHSLNYCVLDVINWKKRTSKETLSDKNILLMTFSPTWHVSFMNPVHHFLNLRFPDHLPLRRGKIAAGGTYMSTYIFFSLEAV